MDIIVYRHHKEDAIKDASNLVEKLKAVVAPNNLIVMLSGTTIYANDIRIDFRSGRIYNLAGLRPDYYETDLYDASEFLAQSAVKCGGKELSGLDDILTIVKGGN